MRYVLLILFVLYIKATYAQGYDVSQRYFSNLVKIIEEEGQYGFIVNFSGNQAHFVTISGSSKLPDKMEVIFANANYSRTANRLEEPFAVGSFFVGLYVVNTNETPTQRYFKASYNANNEKRFYTFIDYERRFLASSKTKIGFAPHIDRDRYVKRALDNLDGSKSEIFFTTVLPGSFAFCGMPVIDDGGNICGLVAATQEDKTSFPIIDIVTIRDKLFKLGEKHGNTCKYFNLIEYNSQNDETFCEKTRREQREANERIKLARKQQIEAMKQTHKMIIDSLYKSGNRDKIVRRIYRSNIDRPLAMSLNVQGLVNFTGLSSTEENTTSSTGWGVSTGYGAGVNFHIAPDKGGLRLSLKPKYGRQKLLPPDQNSFSANPAGYQLSDIKSEYLELPLIIEFVSARTEFFNNYWGIGYGTGKQLSARYTYTTNEGKRTEEMVGASRYFHKAFIEFGQESKRVRASFYLAYQFGSVFPKNYEIIIKGETVKPFQNMPKNSVSMGLEVSLRLWNQWKNDYKTMYNLGL
jgi:hypothetical protein